MPPKNCGVEEARAQLPKLLEDAHHGVTTVITKRGRPYAALVPLDRAEKPGRRGLLLALAGSGAGLWSEEPHRVGALRDEWE